MLNKNPTPSMNKLWSIFQQMNEYPEFYLGKLQQKEKLPQHKCVCFVHGETTIPMPKSKQVFNVWKMRSGLIVYICESYTNHLSRKERCYLRMT
jgi:hypothetical protein